MGKFSRILGRIVATQVSLRRPREAVVVCRGRHAVTPKDEPSSGLVGFRAWSASGAGCDALWSGAPRRRTHGPYAHISIRLADFYPTTGCQLHSLGLVG